LVTRIGIAAMGPMGSADDRTHGVSNPVQTRVRTGP